MLLSSVRSRERQETVPPCPGFLVLSSAWALPLRPVRGSPESRCRSGSQKASAQQSTPLGVRLATLICSRALPGCDEVESCSSRPVSGGCHSLPASRTVAAATRGAPRGCKLGGDVNGLGQTSPWPSWVGWRKGGADPAAAAQ